jgi:hypothetical protein
VKNVQLPRRLFLLCLGLGHFSLISNRES